MRGASLCLLLTMIVVFACAQLAACGGSSISNNVPPGAAPPVSSLLPTDTPPASQSAASAVNLTGSVESVYTGRFLLQSGYPHGFVSVYYSESMVEPSGATVKVGQNVTATGTFNSSGHLIATKVVIGSATPHPSPSPTRTSSPTGLYHIATWAYDSAFGEARSASAASVRLLATYAQGDGKAVSDCHGTGVCQAVAYVNPNHTWNGSPSSCIYHPDADVMAATSESWFVHDTDTPILRTESMG